jgi:hypothetical protein
MLIVVWLAELGEARLEVYVSLIAVAYFACSALFRPRRRLPDIVGASLFLVFCYIVALKVWEILF